MNIIIGLISSLVFINFCVTLFIIIRIKKIRLEQRLLSQFLSQLQECIISSNKIIERIIARDTILTNMYSNIKNGIDELKNCYPASIVIPGCVNYKTRVTDVKYTVGEP